MRDFIKNLHADIEKICKLAKTLDPEFEMVKEHQRFLFTWGEPLSEVESSGSESE